MTERTASAAPVKYCLLTTQRSGSTWLMSTLNGVPGVAGFLELFLPHTPAKDPTWLVDPHPPAFHDWVAGAARPRPLATRTYLRTLPGWAPAARAVGFKLMINQALRYYPEVLPLLRAQGYRLILLTRDPMELAISRYFAQTTRVAHRAAAQRNAPAAPAPVRIDPAWARHDMRRRLLEFRAARAAVRALGFATHRLDYAELAADTPGRIGACAQFLGVDGHAGGAASPLVKVVNAPYTEVVENYDEIVGIAHALYGRRPDGASGAT